MWEKWLSVCIFRLAQPRLKLLLRLCVVPEMVVWVGRKLIVKFGAEQVCQANVVVRIIRVMAPCLSATCHQIANCMYVHAHVA